MLTSHKMGDKHKKRLSIEFADPDRHLASIIDLADKNSSTLGFLPDSAIEEYVHKKQVVVAVDDKSAVLGYLLFRISYQNLAITHLCVEKYLRRRGIAESLITYVENTFPHLYAITLRCRRDYATACELWRHSGFVPIKDIPGRSKSGALLTIWRKQLGQPDLFSLIPTNDSLIRAYIDMNVLIDLYESPNPTSVIAKSLEADWLQGLVELWTTDEILQEINRIDDDTERSSMYTFAAKFPSSGKGKTYDSIRAEIARFFPHDKTDQDISDLNHLAYTISSNGKYFITRDESLLDLDDDLSKKYGIRILTPTEFILKIDEFTNAELYRPSSFKGSEFTISRVSEDMADIIYDSFYNSNLDRSKRSLKGKLGKYFRAPHIYNSIVLRDEDCSCKTICVYCIDEHENNSTNVEFIRLSQGRDNNTLALQLLIFIIGQAYSKKSSRVKILDRHMQNEFIMALGRLGFFHADKYYCKINIFTADTSVNIHKILSSYFDELHIEENSCVQWTKMLTDPNLSLTPRVTSENEHILWPVKVSDSNLPTYIIPIKPVFAHELLGIPLLESTLFPRKKSLVFNAENVYYSARINKSITAPGRILWYVSKGSRTRNNSMKICGYSRLRQIDIGNYSELYQRHERYGVYEIRQLREMSKRGSRKICAYIFDDTEIFSNTVDRAKMIIILKEMKANTNIMSATLIPNEAFLAIYSHATEANSIHE